MRSAQRVIKYFALALAAVLIFVIISGVFSVISLAGFVTWGGDEPAGDTSVIWAGEAKEGALQQLEVSAGATNVRIVEVDKADKPVRIESNSDYIESWRIRGAGWWC